MDVIGETGLGIAILMEYHDILIVGGGIAGLTLACALAQKTPWSIAILESQSSIPTWSEAQHDHRVSAITLASQRIFERLQVWQSMKKKRVSPFTKIDVWDGMGEGKIHFDSQHIAESCLGFIVENNVIQSVLLEKIRDYPQVKFITSIKLAAFHTSDNQVELISEDACSFHAKLVIAADGAHSWLREQAGICLKKNNYSQEAIVTTVQTTLPHQKTARQVFLDTGPLAFLPLMEANTSSIVWSLAKKSAKHLMDIPEEKFKNELAKNFSYRLGEILNLTPRYSFPLHKQVADNYIKPRIALLGDAAHVVHPLAGQGVNMGLLDAASLAECIVDATKECIDIAAIRTLRRYERWRRADHAALFAGIDQLEKLFISDKKSVHRLRSLGLDFVNQLPWVKNIFTRYAVGNRRGLPALARI